jgi:hypothetical protein
MFDVEHEAICGKVLLSQQSEKIAEPFGVGNDLARPLFNHTMLDDTTRQIH